MYNVLIQTYTMKFYLNQANLHTFISVFCVCSGRIRDLLFQLILRMHTLLLTTVTVPYIRTAGPIHFKQALHPVISNSPVFTPPMVTIVLLLLAVRLAGLFPKAACVSEITQYSGYRSTSVVLYGRIPLFIED